MSMPTTTASLRDDHVYDHYYARGALLFNTLKTKRHMKLVTLKLYDADGRRTYYRHIWNRTPMRSQMEKLKGSLNENGPMFYFRGARGESILQELLDFGK